MGLNFDFREMNSRSRQVRRPKNIHDKATIVSIFPKDMSKDFITLEPGYFTIKAGKIDKPSLMTIGSSSWWSGSNPDQPLLEVQVSSVNLAESIIRDIVSGLLCYKVNERQPGLFFLPGEVSLVDLTTKYKNELKHASELQENWYNELIRMANIDWPKAQGNPLAIHDDSRLAANELGRKDLPWMGQFVVQELIPCVACGAPRNPKYPICSSCHSVIDTKLADSLGIKKVG